MKNSLRNSDGITLVELLIAAAILGVLLAALTGLFTGSARGMQANQQLSDRQQNAAVAEQVLKYELGLAGYKGVTSNALTRTFPGDITLAVTRGSSTSPDTVRVQYYEDRLYGEGSAAVLRDVSFSVQTNKGKSYLARREGTGTTNNLVEGVTNLKVTNYVRRNGDIDPATSTIPPTLVGLQLELTFSDAPAKTVFISFQNPQHTSSTQASTGQ
jgi:Tfp pilus assembly protein PilW